jgi:hypothetical protein
VSDKLTSGSVENVWMVSELGSLYCPKISLGDTCLQAEWHPVWRRRELDSGFHVQRGNLSFR